MLTLYGRTTSVNVQKVLWALAELGVEHRRLDRGGSHGGLDDPAFLAMNPNRRIPVIDDDGVVVFESNAIVRYLAARHGAGTLWPKDAGERAQADQWMDWMQTTLAPDFYDLFWKVIRTPAERREPAAIEVAAARCHAHYGLLDERLQQRSFLAGDGLTMGDLPAGTTLYRYFACLDEAELEPPPLAALAAWYERLAARPAYRSQVMTSYEPLRGRLS
jgi:glutathione S-transferase